MLASPAVPPGEPALEKPLATVPEASSAPSLSAPAVAPEISQKKQKQVDPEEDVRKKPRMSPILIVPPNWEVPIHQKMVDIFALSRKPVGSPPQASEAAEIVADDELGVSDGQQDKCPDELKLENEDGEPPVTLRTQQWKLRPSRGRGRGRGRGKGRGKGRDDGEVGIVESSGEEAEAEMESVADVKPKRPRARAKATAKAKSKPASAKSAPKAAPKRRGKKKAEEVEASAEADAVETDGDKEAEKTAAMESNVEEERGWGCLFSLAFEPGDHNPELQAEPGKLSDPEPSRKKAKTGESANGRSFARRVCPKLVPAKQQWEAIKDLFEKVEWWDWCKDAFKNSEKVKEAMTKLKDEKDQGVRGRELLQVYLQVADIEIRKFMMETELVEDESDIPPL
eukprot:s1115_g4.t1